MAKQMLIKEQALRILLKIFLLLQVLLQFNRLLLQ
jgi:hypothetical protein